MKLRFNVITLLSCTAILAACDNGNGEYDFKDLDCNKAMVCQTKKGKPVIGMVKTYYPDGKLKREISYIKGLREGIMTYYHENGAIEAKVPYKSNLVDGEVLSYYDDGTPAGDCNYKANKLDGICKIYNEDGTPLSEENYKNGVKDGETIDYHNGFVISKSIYNNDVLIGRESFDDNGILQHKLFADDNGEFNRYQSYYPDGAVKIDAEISGFEIAGKVKEYYNNGHVKSEYQIKNGALTGEYTTYRKNGNISYSEAYTAGETLNGEKKLQAAIVQMKLRFMYGIVKDILSEN